MHTVQKIFFFLSICLFSGLNSCNNAEKKEAVSMDNYEKSKVSLEETEQKNPVKFLSINGKNKKNLIGQTVVKASIKNHAKVVTYKDIDIKLSFYSKTGALLEEDHVILYESIAPGESNSFKSKYFAPKSTDSVAFKIIRAKY